MVKFVHLHNHSHFSLLDGACRIKDLVKAAKEYEMPALALTDHGNLFGCIEFYKACRKEKIKPVIGTEIYVAPGSRFDKQSAGPSGTAFHLVLLCKDYTGYRNLMKLVSAGYREGFYYKPRIDHELLENHARGLIALSACLKGKVASTALRQGKDKALQVIEKYKAVFGDDFYLEVQNHGIKEEDRAREMLLQLAVETNVKVIATNDIHYLRKEHSEAHDILLCLQTGKDYDDPNRLRYSTNQLYFKSFDEMRKAFPDTPELLENTVEVAEKCNLELNFNENHLPHFEIPDSESFDNLNDYLKHLSCQGLKERYQEITPELEERLRHELDVIHKMGYAGYFLITYDFINYARRKGIPVGPGRGSAAGSLVAYCLYITNIDPIRYDLIFERFLNIERVSMPDIDIDFCYERREEVIKYVKDKYGHDNVCQIITFGTMAARAVIRDVGRVLKMSYGDVDRIAKLVPAQPHIKLDDAIKNVPELRQLEDKDDMHRRLIQYSRVLEGLARHASTHAAGVVITPEELTNYVPIYKSKEDEVTSQYDKNSLESVGLLKMDFLGLRTLTVIQKTVDALRARGIEIDIEKIPPDNPETYELFVKGETIGIFQFESSGMREYLKKLGPECFEDLIAMNALYRPGPMEWIEDFLNRKKGRTPIEYLHPLLEPILKETYGVAIYQEQVTKIASTVGGFTLGHADIMRRAMGKKDKVKMAQQETAFVQGAQERGVDAKVAEEIFAMLAKFAGYGFNKSHAACYSLVAYQTGYLKAHYPAEFMAATISSEMSSSNRVTILLEECKRIGLKVLPPDVNESYTDFIVTEGGIRFGLGAVKNVGRGAIEAIVRIREKEGRFKNIFSLVQNADLSSVNKKVMESLIEAGAMDSLEGTRAQLYSVVETAMEFGQRYQNQKANGQYSMFEIDEETLGPVEPPLPTVEEWSPAMVLNREKSILGFYLSGHPLDRFREEVQTYSTLRLDDLEHRMDGTQARLCGIISDLKTHVDRQKRPMAFLKIEDFTGSIEGLAFSDTYQKYRDLLHVDKIVTVIGKLSMRDEAEAAKLIVDEIIPIEEVRQRYTKILCLSMDIDKTSDHILQQVKDILVNHSGSIPVYIRLSTRDNGNFMLRSKSFKVDPNLSLLEKLREKIGHDNVWMGA